MTHPTPPKRFDLVVQHGVLSRPVNEHGAYTFAEDALAYAEAEYNRGVCESIEKIKVHSVTTQNGVIRFSTSLGDFSGDCNLLFAEIKKQARLDALEEAAKWMADNIVLACIEVQIGKEPFYLPATESITGEVVADRFRKLKEGV
jgi:hypothetical protein